MSRQDYIFAFPPNPSIVIRVLHYETQKYPNHEDATLSSSGVGKRYCKRTNGVRNLSQDVIKTPALTQTQVIVKTKHRVAERRRNDCVPIISMQQIYNMSLNQLRISTPSV